MSSTGFRISFSIILLHLFEATTALKVGILGSGIGAASSAYHLRQYFQNNVSLHVYDGGPIGGRINEIDIQGELFESGASIIHKRNRYVRDFARMLNLSECDSDGNKRLVIFNGVKPAFVGSSWSWVTALKLLWRYGPDLFRIKSSVSDMLDKFDNIYQMQSHGQAFADVESLLKAWNPEFPGYLNVSLSDLLLSKGYSERFIDELANAAVRNNYNQRSKDINAFVGMVSMCGFLPGLFSIRGGNAEVVRRLIKISKVNFHPNFVKTIEETSGTVKNPLYSLHLQNGEIHKGFDYVIIAAPRYSQSAAAWPKFVNVDPDLLPVGAIKYQPVTATFVVGNIKSRHFRLPDDKNDYAIFMTGRARTDPLNSISIHHSVNCEPKKESRGVWKVFSEGLDPLPSKTIDDLFFNRTFTKAKRWHGAYPKYFVPTKTAGLRFMIAPRLICLYPIEQVASAMEMSAIAGVNAALLVKNEFKMKEDFIYGIKGSGRKNGRTARPDDEL